MEGLIRLLGPQYPYLIEKLKELEKEFIHYKKNCLIKMNYALNDDYGDYDDCVIEGESTLDMILEELERSDSLFEILNDILKENFRVFCPDNAYRMLHLRNLILGSYQKRIDERNILERRKDKIINGLNEISEQQREKEIEIEKNNIHNKKIEYSEFVEKMNKYKIHSVLFDNYGISKEEKRQIDEWTKRKIKKVLFETNVDLWSGKRKELDSLIFYKEKLLFWIETTGYVKFGGYLSSRIDRYGWINDPKAFLFSFYGGKSTIFRIKKPENAFYFNPKHDDSLFAFGFNEMKIHERKLQIDINCSSPTLSSYDYGRNENILVGRFGTNCCKIKRLLVISMY